MLRGNIIVGGFSILNDMKIRELGLEVTMEEVHRSVFSMSSLKAPKVDGLHVKFY